MTSKVIIGGLILITSFLFIFSIDRPYSMSDLSGAITVKILIQQNMETRRNNEKKLIQAEFDQFTNEINNIFEKAGV